jgi:branched-chain amino acid transport system permease protein
MRLFPLPLTRWTMVGIGVLFFVLFPLVANDYFLNIGNLVFIAVVGAIGLNIQVGYTGQVSIGHGAFIAIRDRDVAAEIIGINLFRYKLLAFAVSSFYAGVTGVLYAHYLGIANYEQFDLSTTVDFLAMIIIGGLGSILGSIFGAIFITVLPMVLRAVMDAVGNVLLLLFPTLNVSYVVQSITSIKLILFGVLIIVFLIAEPDGLNKLWRNIRDYFRFWPYSY